MALLLSLIYVVLVAVAGYVALSTICGPENWHWAKLVGLSFASGAGLLPIVLFAISLIGFAPNRVILLVFTAAIVAGFFVLRHRKRLLTFSIPSSRKRESRAAENVLAVLAIAVILLTSANVAAEAFPHGLPDVDSYAIWMFKAKIAATEPLRPVPAALLDPGLSFSHQDYPFGFPLLVTGVYAAAGRIDAELGKIILLPIYFSLICVAYAALRSLLRRASALIMTAVFVSSPVLCQHAGMPVAEVTLVLMHLCSLVLLVEWITTGNRRTLIIAGAFAAFAAFTKNEGLALLPLFGAGALLIALLRRSRRAFADCSFSIAVAIALLLPWLIYRRFLPHTHEDYGSKLTSIQTVVRNLPRLAIVLPAYLSHLIELNTAGGIWIVLAFAALIGWRAFKDKATIVLWIILLAHLALYAFTFMVTPWDLNILIPMISDKLLMHVAPAALILIGLHLQAFRRFATAFGPDFQLNSGAGPSENH